MQQSDCLLLVVKVAAVTIKSMVHLGQVFIDLLEFGVALLACLVQIRLDKIML